MPPAVARGIVRGRAIVDACSVAARPSRPRSSRRPRLPEDASHRTGQVDLTSGSSIRYPDRDEIVRSSTGLIGASLALETRLHLRLPSDGPSRDRRCLLGVGFLPSRSHRTFTSFSAHAGRTRARHPRARSALGRRVGAAGGSARSRAEPPAAPTGRHAPSGCEDGEHGCARHGH